MELSTKPADLPVCATGRRRQRINAVRCGADTANRVGARRDRGGWSRDTGTGKAFEILKSVPCHHSAPSGLIHLHVNAVDVFERLDKQIPRLPGFGFARVAKSDHRQWLLAWLGDVEAEAVLRAMECINMPRHHLLQWSARPLLNICVPPHCDTTNAQVRGSQMLSA